MRAREIAEQEETPGTGGRRGSRSACEVLVIRSVCTAAAAAVGREGPRGMLMFHELTCLQNGHRLQWAEGPRPGPETGGERGIVSSLQGFHAGGARLGGGLCKLGHVPTTKGHEKSKAPVLVAGCRMGTGAGERSWV